MEKVLNYLSKCRNKSISLRLNKLSTTWKHLHGAEIWLFVHWYIRNKLTLFLCVLYDLYGCSRVTYCEIIYWPRCAFFRVVKLIQQLNCQDQYCYNTNYANKLYRVIILLGSCTKLTVTSLFVRIISSTRKNISNPS